MKIATICAALLATVTFGTAVSAKEMRRPRDPSTTGAIGTQWVGLAAARNGRVFQLDGSTEAGARSAARLECEQMSGRECRAIAVPMQWDVVVLQCNGRGRSDAFFGGSIEGNASWIAAEKARQNGFNESQCRQIYSY